MLRLLNEVAIARPKNESLHKERRLQILQAAAGVFRAKGFHAARTEEICVAAGMSAGTVFRYFRDKEEIIATIAEMEFEAYQEMTRTLFTREGFAALAEIGGEQMRRLMQPGGFGLGLDSWLELYRDEQRAATYKAKDDAMREQLALLLRQGQAEGWVRAQLDPEEAARVLITLHTGMFVEMQGDPGLDLEQAAGGLRGLLRAYILVEA